MPHFHAMDRALFGTAKGTLLRSRLHYVRSYALLRDGYLEHGAAVLFDALLQALRWRSDVEGVVIDHPCQGMWCERELFEALAARLIVSTDFDMNGMMDRMERMIDGDTEGVDTMDLFRRIESILEELGVLPLDDSDPDFTKSAKIN